MNFNKLQKRGENLTRAESSRLAREMLRQYAIALEKINIEVEKAYKAFNSNTDPAEYYNLLVKSGRYMGLQSRIQDIYNYYAKRAGDAMIEGSSVAFINNYYRQQYAKAWYAPFAKPPVLLNFTLVDPVAVELSVLDRVGLYNSIKNRQRKNKLAGFVPANEDSDFTVVKGWNKNIVKGANRIGDAVTNGLIRGLSLPKMRSQIKEAMGWSTNMAKRYARTEANKSLNGGQYLSYLDAREQGLNDEREIVSTLDLRTRAQSVSVDGLRDGGTGFFMYPGGRKVTYPGNSGVLAWDINDRETTIEIIAGITPQLRRGRNPHTGKTEVSSYKGYNEWAKSHGLTQTASGKWVVDTSKKVKPIRTKLPANG